MSNKNKMWDGRFNKPSARLMEEFNNSLDVDVVFIEEDIAGSKAWASALAKEGVLSAGEVRAIHDGLDDILRRHQAGEELFLHSDEDIHMAVERVLTEQIGAAASKLHTGRSRNDQVATDFRLYVKNRLTETGAALRAVQAELLERARSDQHVIIPGYTHYQQAQPVSLAHYWLSFFFLLERDRVRIENARRGADMLPLGSGAIAGSGFPVDRDFLAEQLGFGRVSENSIDGVASRDFVLEALNACASVGIHISRYAEDLIVWSTAEFSFVELDDQWSTGSSMMPQKKNPDSLELIRGKAGRLLGNYTRFATTLKGVGLSYFKDLQEDKEPFIDSAAELRMILEVLANVLRTLTVKPAEIEKRLNPFLIATDMADYLVRKGLPFRESHHVIGRIVGYSVDSGVALNQISVEKLQEFSQLFEDDVTALFNWNTALKGRDIPGGTGPKSVAAQLKKAEKLLSL
ncbi:MAG: argininosuccinate lyase [Fibrobacterota bacterium]